MGKAGWAIALDMLVEPDAGASLGQHARKRGLADIKRAAGRRRSIRSGRRRTEIRCR
jgi:hypothetical protein